MKELVVAIKNKTSIINELKSSYEISFYKEQSFFDKLLLKDKRYPDIYFHQGIINTEALDMIEHSKLTILNCRALKSQVEEKRSYINEDKIEVIYPYIHTSLSYSKEMKKEFRALHDLEKETRILLFSAKNIDQGGVDKFLEIALHLENKNFVLLFDIEKNEEEKLQLKLQKMNLQDKRLGLRQEYSLDQLLIFSDIFILPTKQKLFAPAVLKAMYFRNVVFVMRDNMASELIDSFSLILGDDDRSVNFKVDALLVNKKELKTIQKENYQVVKNMTKESYLEELKKHIEFHIEEES